MRTGGQVLFMALIMRRRVKLGEERAKGPAPRVAAPEAEQDRRAPMLYARAGSSPRRMATSGSSALGMNLSMF